MTKIARHPDADGTEIREGDTLQSVVDNSVIHRVEVVDEWRVIVRWSEKYAAPFCFACVHDTTEWKIVKREPKEPHPDAKKLSEWMTAVTEERMMKRQWPFEHVTGPVWGARAGG